MNKNKSFIFFLLLTLLLLPFAQVSIRFFRMPVYLPELSLLFAAASFFIYGRRQSIRIRYPKKIYLIGAGLILGGSIVSLFANGITVQELGAFKSWIVFPLVFSFLLFQIGEDPRERYRMLGAWFLGVAFTSLISLLPFFSFLATYDGRLRFFYPSPNHLAMFIVPGILIGIFFCMRTLFAEETNGKKEKKRGMLFAQLLVVGLMSLALVQTASLGGRISALTGMAALVFFLCLPRRMIRRSLFPLLSAGAILCVALTVTVDWRGLASGEVRSSLGSRVMIWNTSLLLISEHPIAGIGMRNFQDAYLGAQPQFPSYMEWAVPHPHNIFFAFWLFTGLVGLVGFLALSCGLLRDLFRGIMRHSSKESACGSINALFLSLFLAFLVFGVVDTPYFKNDLALSFWALVALAIIPCGTKKSATVRG